MENEVWTTVQKMNLNTLIVPVYWECIEPEKDQFDFSLVDGLLKQARERDIRLSLLWFGLWKNSASWYVPSWIKTDRKTYWYVMDEGNVLPVYFSSPALTISPLCRVAVEADKKAFSQLMRHLAQTDPEHTVIMVQVENEMGVLGTKRDHFPLAEELFHAPVPAELADRLGVSGSWEEAFPDNPEESFMAWHYARATEEIASAEKRN